MSASNPLIGMTELIPFCKTSEFAPLLLDAEFVQTHISAKNVAVTGPYANSLHIRIEDEIFRDPIGLKKFQFVMESELILEKTDEGAWDFYVLHNNLFYSLNGRIRIRQIGIGMKIGLYLVDLISKEPIEEEFKEDELIVLIRSKFRKFFEKLRQSCKTGFRIQPEQTNLKSIN